MYYFRNFYYFWQEVIYLFYRRFEIVDGCVGFCFKNLKGDGGKGFEWRREYC